MQTGLALELQVKQLLEEELAAGILGFSMDSVRVIHRAKYYSRERCSDIVVDVSLEVFRPETDDPFLLWILECKDYHGQVPVDDVEEFHAKLEQIGSHKAKGTIASRNGFQKSAVAYATAKAIGLARVSPLQGIVRQLELSNSLSNEIVMGHFTGCADLLFAPSFCGITSAGHLSCSIVEMLGSVVDNLH